MEQPLQPTGQAQNAPVKKAWYKKWWVITIAVIIGFPILVDLLDGPEEKVEQPAAAQEVKSDTPAVAEKVPETPPTPKTDQQVLEEKLSGMVSSIGGKDMTYRGIDIQKPDADRPKDTKMVTVKVDLKSFYSKNSLLRDTGELSTSIFQAVYDVPSIQAYDVIVWYYAETTDRYGNKKNDVVLTYFIDKLTHGKINWQNFDKKAACEFLEQEAKVTGTMDTGCKTLVNIQ